MFCAKGAVMLLVVVASWGPTPGEAIADNSKMAMDGLEGAADFDKNRRVSYVERQFKDGLESDAEEDESDDGENGDEDDGEEDGPAAEGEMSKFSGIVGLQDKRRHAFRSDLGKRNQLHLEAPHQPIHGEGIIMEKRYRSFKADLGKRYSRFRSDLGKRFEGESNQGEPDLPQWDGGSDNPGPVYLLPEKRPKFRADLGKRARYEASRRVFRADLGKRRLFRSDLG